MRTTLTSRHNVRVRALRAALARPTGAVVAVEGPHLVREALASPNIRILAVFIGEDNRDTFEEMDGATDQFLLPRAVFDSVAATEHSQGIAALIERPRHPYAPRSGHLLLVLDGVQDPGNVGTLLRSAEAFGAAAVAVTTGTADVWNGKALRASAGASFRMPVVPWSTDLHRRLRAERIRLLVSVVGERGALRAADARLHEGCAIVIGNEGQGVSAAMHDLADERITLAMPGPTESLNAGVAGSILLYEAARQRAGATEGFGLAWPA